MQYRDPHRPTVVVGCLSVFVFIVGLILWVWIGDVGWKIALTAAIVHAVALLWDMTP